MANDEDGQWEEIRQVVRDSGIIPNFAVLFIDSDNSIVHAVFHEDYPNIADVSHNIEEMKNEEFGIGEDVVDELKMVIINIEDGGDIE